MILGTGKTYLTYDGSEIVLNYSSTDFDIYKNQDVEFRSIITGIKTHYELYDYSEFTITERLFLEDDPISKFSEINGLIGDKIHLNLFGSENIIFAGYIIELKPIYLRGFVAYDVCKIIIESNPGKMGKYLVDKQGRPYKDKAGNYIRRKLRGLE